MDEEDILFTYDRQQEMLQRQLDNSIIDYDTYVMEVQELDMWLKEELRSIR